MLEWRGSTSFPTAQASVTKAAELSPAGTGAGVGAGAGAGASTVAASWVHPETGHPSKATPAKRHLRFDARVDRMKK